MKARAIVSSDPEEMERQRRDLLIHVGVALLDVQVTESLLRLVATYVLQRPGERLTAERLFSQLEREQKKTLGYFITELRKRADLAPQFDSMLSSFLQRRNILAHHLSEIPGWDTETLDGVQAGRRFLSELITINGTVRKVFLGLVRHWQLQTAVPSPPWPDNATFGEVDERFAPLVDDIFTAKE